MFSKALSVALLTLGFICSTILFSHAQSQYKSGGMKISFAIDLARADSWHLDRWLSLEGALYGLRDDYFAFGSRPESKAVRTAIAVQAKKVKANMRQEHDNWVSDVKQVHATYHQDYIHMDVMEPIELLDELIQFNPKYGGRTIHRIDWEGHERLLMVDKDDFDTNVEYGPVNFLRYVNPNYGREYRQNHVPFGYQGNGQRHYAPTHNVPPGSLRKRLKGETNAAFADRQAITTISTAAKLMGDVIQAFQLMDTDGPKIESAFAGWRAIRGEPISDAAGKFGPAIDRLMMAYDELKQAVAIWRELSKHQHEGGDRRQDLAKASEANRLQALASKTISEVNSTTQNRTQ